MSVEKMKLLSITGKEENIDKFISDYLLDSGIQTENAVKVFEKGWNLKNFNYDSTPKELLKECKDLLLKYKMKFDPEEESQIVYRPLENVEEELYDIKTNFNEFEEYIKEKKDEYSEVSLKLNALNNIKDIDIDLNKLAVLEYIKYRYGKISIENYGRLENSLKDINGITVKLLENKEENFYWVMCFIAKENIAIADSYLNVLKFERYEIPSGMIENPKETFEKNEKRIQELAFDIENKENELIRILNRDEEDLVNIYKELNLYVKINNVKKFMAYDENGLFYIIGWVPAKELTSILPKLAKEKDIKYIVKNHDEVASIPPTKLKNNKIVRPFETIVKMYGLPNYTELDPTSFVAITAFLLFGFMFGDLGQGFVIFLLGILLSLKKISLGPVFEAGGISAMIFGVLYGSIFGKEGIIKPIFISPMENIQTMLMYGIGIGVLLIVIAMILNIKNGIKNKDMKKVFFDTNGIAGLIFYLIVLIVGIYFLLKGKLIVSIGILSILILIPLILIMFKDIFAKKIFKEQISEKTSMIERIFEIIEILLSFTSNTISFVRIAAFAINHVGLCMAVFILSEMMTGTGSVFVVVIGNILVIGLEGLIVAIQVLRLEYYELFSRFYSGDGKEYKPLREKI